MLITNKKNYILFIYALYSICNFQIANCESLADVSTPDISKFDKTLGYLLVAGTTLICGYLIYKGISPTDGAETVIQKAVPLVSKNNVATTIKNNTELSDSSLEDLKNTPYLLVLQELTKHNK